MFVGGSPHSHLGSMVDILSNVYPDDQYPHLFLLEKYFLQYLHTARIFILHVFRFGQGSSVKCCHAGEVHGLFPLLRSPASSLCTETLSIRPFSGSMGVGGEALFLPQKMSHHQAQEEQ